MQVYRKNLHPMKAPSLSVFAAAGPRKPSTSTNQHQWMARGTPTLTWTNYVLPPRAYGTSTHESNDHLGVNWIPTVRDQQICHCTHGLELDGYNAVVAHVDGNIQCQGFTVEGVPYYYCTMKRLCQLNIVATSNPRWFSPRDGRGAGSQLRICWGWKPSAHWTTRFLADFQSTGTISQNLRQER